MILPLEKQVCSLELAKRLKELGAPQEALYYWDSHAINKIDGYNDYRFGISSDGEYSAYTVAELGELLPSKIDGNFIETSKCLDGSGYNCCAGYLDSTKSSVSFCERTEADARAKMLIYLLENKF